MEWRGVPSHRGRAVGRVSDRRRCVITNLKHIMPRLQGACRGGGRVVLAAGMLRRVLPSSSPMPSSRVSPVRGGTSASWRASRHEAA